MAFSGPFGLGGHPSPPDERDFQITDRLVAGVTLPARFVASPMGNVLNQGLKPECVAYATAGMRAHQELSETTPSNPTWDEDWFYAACKAIDGISGPGTTGRAAMTVALKQGYRTLGHTDEAGYRINAYYAVPLDYATMKAAIHQFGPLVYGTTWYTSWFGPLIGPNGILPAPAGGVAGGHEVLIFGWDDRKLAGGKELGHLIVRNSWGKTWGNGQGNFYLPASYLRYGSDSFKSLDLT